MNYYGGRELATAFRTVRANTIQIAEDIPENKYDFKPSAESRTIGQTFVHIAVGTTFPMMLHGERIPIEKIDFGEFMKKIGAEEAKPRNKAEIVALLKDSGEKFAAMLEKLEEPFFGEVITFQPGAEPPSRTRFDMLLAAKEHEMHHRAQLMMMERMIGIVPHLTRRQQERMARFEAQRAQATR
jgi:uncharacterized damage-inducible protein DinB